MQYNRISADCHLDMPWMPPTLFTSRSVARAEGPHAVRDRRPGRAAVGHQDRRHFRPEERRRPDRRQAGAGTEPPRRHHGRDRPVRRRPEGHPPRQRSASARQGHGPRRRRCRGDLRHPRFRLEAEGPRGGGGDVQDLQRLAEGFLQPLSGPPYRSRLPAVWRRRLGGAGDPSLRQDGPEGAGAVVLVGHGADVASVLGAAVAGGQRGAVAAALPHLPDHAAAARAR